MIAFLTHFKVVVRLCRCSVVFLSETLARREMMVLFEDAQMDI